MRHTGNMDVNIGLTELCRLCLKGAGFHNVFKIRGLLFEIYEFTGVKVFLADNLPQSICRECSATIKKMKNLKEIATANDMYMRDLTGDGDKLESCEPVEQVFVVETSDNLDSNKDNRKPGADISKYFIKTERITADNITASENTPETTELQITLENTSCKDVSQVAESSYSLSPARPQVDSSYFFDINTLEKGTSSVKETGSIEDSDNEEDNHEDNSEVENEITQNKERSEMCVEAVNRASSDEDSFSTTNEEREQVCSFLPEKSREIYLRAYKIFNDWRLSKGVKTYSETVLLTYFMEISKTRTPSTLWSIYSMLKAVLKTKRDVNIETYPKLVAFIKNKALGYKAKKTKVFTAPEIEKFVTEAPDSIYLGTKAILIIGIYGACRSNQLLNIRVNDIEKHSDKLIVVKLHSTKKKMEKSFVIHEKYADIIDKYMALRPTRTKTDRFFLQYVRGKCRVQAMGINKIGETPRKVATFLKLPDPHLYTGHCMKRTSVSLLADSGADLTGLNRRDRGGDWTSTADDEGYTN